MNQVELFIAIRNTVVVCIGCMAIAVPTGTLLAILLRRTDIFLRHWAWIAIGSQLAVPLYAFAGAWNAGFGFQGWWPLAQVVAMQFQASAMLAAIFVHAVAAIPWVCFIISCGLLGSHRSLEETALAEEGNWGVLRRAIAPNLGGWIGLSCFWVCVPILTEMVITNLYQVQTVAERVYLDASRGMVSGLTYPVAVFFCVLPVVAIAWTVRKRLPYWSDVIARARQHETMILACGPWRLPLSALAWSIIIVLVGMPMINLLIKAGWHPYVDSAGTTRYGWTTQRLVTTIHESFSQFLSEFYWSGILAFAAATLALTVAIGLCCLTVKRWQRGLVYLLMLTLIGTPGAIVGMILIFLLNRDLYPLDFLYDQTITAPILAQQFRLLPIAWIMTQSIFATVDRKSTESAELDGLGYWQYTQSILWPQTGKLWLVAWILLMVVSVGELSTTILVLPPGVTTLAKRLFEMLHYGMRHQDSGLCLMLILVGWISSIVVWKTLKDRNIGND